MSPWSKFKLKIKRRETPFYTMLYDIAIVVRGFSVPVIPGLHRFLYSEWATRTAAWHGFWRIVYYEPMFKSQCRKVGKKFRMEYAGNGSCRIYGNLNIYLGDNVYMFDNVSLVGKRVFDEPELHIGDNTYIGPELRLTIGKKVSIGSNCIIASSMISDDTGHPFDAEARCTHGGGQPPAELISPVAIGDFCFLGTGTFVYPGSNLGDGVVAKIGTHIKGKIPPFALVEGRPCRIVKLMPLPEGLRAKVGEERFAGWQQERQEYLDKIDGAAQ